jgi:hypothetical protein
MLLELILGIVFIYALAGLLCGEWGGPTRRKSFWPEPKLPDISRPETLISEEHWRQLRAQAAARQQQSSLEHSASHTHTADAQTRRIG